MDQKTAQAREALAAKHKEDMRWAILDAQVRAYEKVVSVFEQNFGPITFGVSVSGMVGVIQNASVDDLKSAKTELDQLAVALHEAFGKIG